MSILIKHQTVLVRDVQPEIELSTEEILFVQEEKRDICGSDGYFLPLTLWEEMGKPEIITVQVEPGDKLNG